MLSGSGTPAQTRPPKVSNDISMKGPETEIDITGLPSPYQIFRYVTGTEHMHFGLFIPLEIDGREAQSNMMEKLLGFFPEGPRRVLDLGCGIGGTSCHLGELGHTVHGIAPEQGLIDYARRLAERRAIADRVTFDATKFEDFAASTDETFEVILSQESFQYLPWLKEALQSVHDLLDPGGRAIIGDQVLRHPPARFECQFHITEELLAHAETAGLRCVHHEDVTEAAQPSGPRSIALMEARRDEIIDYFRPYQPDIETAFHTCVDFGRAEQRAYEDGMLGYEIFVFEK